MTLNRSATLKDGVVLSLKPIGTTAARAFVGTHHRHNLPPKMVMWAVSVVDEADIVRGVAMVGRPVARMLDDGFTAEVVRCCTDGAENACSILYGACARAARALGYKRLFTYTLESELGTSLKASGWTSDASLGVRPSWDTPSRPRIQEDIFGEPRRPTEPKIRWIKEFV